MSILKRAIQGKALPLVRTYSGLENLRPLDNQPRFIGSELTLYPADSGERFLTKGYNLNDAVYSIVSTNSEKAGQVRFYHSKVKRDERKTLKEYNQLSTQPLTPQLVKELVRMRKTMIEETVVDSPLSKILAKPNRNQAWNEFVESLFALRELQGEGNILFMRDEGGRRVLEMHVIPKPQLNLIGNTGDLFDVVGYELVLGSQREKIAKDNLVMWKYSNPRQIDTTFEHLRGLAPLTSAIVLLQGMNEGDIRVATSNKNGGASGFAFRKDVAGQNPSQEQIQAVRASFNNAVNSSEMVNKVGIVGGDWGYYNLGVSLADQKILEQYGWGFERLCRVFKTPPGIFGHGNDTYENQRQYNRSWIYSKIATNMYNLRAVMNEKLLPAFDLDRETNLVDCDIMSLPEMTTDAKEQIDAAVKADFLTPNEKRTFIGYEPLDDPAMDKIYVSGNMTSLDDLNVGGDLSNEMNLLNP